MVKRKGAVLLVCILAILVGCITMYYPTIKDNSTSFSFIRAKEDLKVIAKEPHTTLHHKEALNDVRQYIVNELEKLNMNPEIFSYKDIKTDRGEVTDLSNIYGKIDGKDGENGSYILLVAHYDSGEPIPINNKGYSYGVADDGYGVVTILETLRSIRNSGKTLENGIKILLTDGEEIHLLGSEKEFNNNFSLYKNVSYVINLEARGTSGPVIMVQTNEKNDRVLELYKSAKYPMTSSLVTDLYKDSGRSDFLNIESKELPGINLAILDSVENYHTPGDCYENVSDSSLKHYGDQVVPIVEKFIYSSEYKDLNYFKSGTESIFFTLLPNVVLDYSVTLGIILSTIIIIAVIVIMIKNRDKIKDMLKAMVKNLLYIIGASLLGYIISFGLATTSGVEFDLNYMCKVPGDDVLLIILPIILSLVVIKWEIKNKDNTIENFWSGVLIQTILLSGSIIFLPGASYLFMIPLMLTLISLVIIKLTNKQITKYMLLVAVVAMILLFIPQINIFHMAFSIGALPIIFAMLMVMNALIAPIINKILQ